MGTMLVVHCRVLLVSMKPHTLAITIHIPDALHDHCEKYYLNDASLRSQSRVHTITPLVASVDDRVTSLRQSVI